MAEAGPPEPPRELSELEGLSLKINEKSDETLESTRRMREMCAEAKDAGMKTLIALDDQEEQIDKFEEAMDGINGDMALAETALKVRVCGPRAAVACSPRSYAARLGLARQGRLLGQRFKFTYARHVYRDPKNFQFIFFWADL